ncbi:hypothetical protein PybrP1_007992 [[Pythium] brassicae (nom. inval.)]|nr:hypothetical protein PybrP1_007992 [[Pythium] brassicae (nom. inval.)]
MPTSRIWLRLELFELGLLVLPSRHAATLTVAHVARSLDALHVRFQAAQAAADGDAEMHDAERRAAFTESDNLHSVTFPFWRDAVADVFQWREQDYRAFWLLLVQFHRRIPVKAAYVAATDALVDEAHCLAREQVPVFKIAIFLFVQTVKPHSWRAKYSLEPFDAVWYREHAAALDAAAAVGASSSPLSAPTSGSGNRSPQLKGSASPTLQASPHTMGMQDRSTSDAYYLEFVREKLGDLFALLFPSVELQDGSETIVSADQVDLLGFLLCVGSSEMVDSAASLSASYPAWPSSAEQSAGDAFLAGGLRAENGAKICAFFKKNLSLNETLYPPVGFTLSSASSFLLSSDTSPATSPPEAAPTVLSNFAKTTVIKRAEEFGASSGGSDLIIFSCHDTFIYALGASRYPLPRSASSTNVMITACNNCKIVTGPNTGILSLDRCENVHVTAVSSLIRVSNCLDSVINSYTLVPLIMSGENVGVQLGPYNAKYSGLAQQLADAHFVYNAESPGAWSSFVNLDSEKVDSAGGNEKAPISVQSPAAFREVVVPVKVAGNSSAGERPFPLPQEYAAALKAQHETVEALRHLVRSDEFDLATKRTMETVIQTRFKEWLSTTGNARQILDLVHIERSRSALSSSANASPAKDRAV